MAEKKKETIRAVYCGRAKLMNGGLGDLWIAETLLTGLDVDQVLGKVSAFKGARQRYVIGGIYEGAGSLDENGRISTWVTKLPWTAFKGRVDHPFVPLAEVTAAEQDLRTAQEAAEKRVKSSPVVMKELKATAEWLATVPPHKRYAAIQGLVSILDAEARKVRRAR